MARKIKRKGTWLKVEVAPGEVAHFRRPRQSQIADLRNAATTFHKEFVRSLRVRAGKLSEDAPQEDVPGAEFEALSRFLAGLTIKLEGPEWEDSSPLVWAQMSADERLDYFEGLPFGRVPALYAEITSKLGIENNPAILEGLAQSMSADSPDEVGEEE